MGPIEELGSAIGAVAAKAGPSTVGVGNRWRGGSGVVLEAGKVLTNAHNLHGDEVHVYFADGREGEGKVLGADGDGDLAVIGVDTGDAPAITWGEGSALGIGSPVVAIGNPAGNGLRVTVGYVSGIDRAFRGPRGRRVAGAVEHTAPLLPGSSGGPIVDGDGKLLGINTNRLGDGFYLAIPADAELRGRLDALARGEAPARPRLGVGIAHAGVARRMRHAVGLPERDGLLVRAVEDGGPAGRAGVRVGDLIVSAGDREVRDADELHEVLDALPQDGTLQLALVRGTEELTLTVAFGSEAERVGSA